jgi:hypothetical protein
LDKWKVFLAASGALIVAGGIFEWLNIAVTQIAILFTITGAATGLFSLYQARDKKVAASAAAPDAGPLPPGGKTVAPRLSRIYPGAFFIAALLLILSTVVELAIINSVVVHPPISSRTDLTNHLLALLVEIVAPVGYFGFSLILAGRARRFGITATIFVLINFIVNGVALFSYLVNFVAGANVPLPVFAYFQYAAVAGIVASVFLAIAVDRSDIYPQWIAVVFLADALTEVFYLLYHLNWVVLDAVSAGDLLLAVAYVGMGICMLRRIPARAPASGRV